MKSMEGTKNQAPGPYGKDSPNNIPHLKKDILTWLFYGGGRSDSSSPIQRFLRSTNGAGNNTGSSYINILKTISSNSGD